MNIPILILAAGASLRLGRPKQLELINGESLLNKTISSALESGVGDVFVVLGSEIESIKANLKKRHLFKVLYHSNWKEGMGSSISHGMQFLENIDCKAVIISVCDQPFISRHNFKQLVNSYDGRPETIIASKYLKGFGPPTLFGKVYFQQLYELEGEEGGRRIIESNMPHVSHCEFNRGHIDIDNQSDLDLLIG